MGLDIYFIKKKRSEIGYFRKVNFLVRFFEEKGMNVEDQIPFTINKGMAEELLSRCKEVLANHSKAEELLPTMNGFFFGSTDYDEYYFSDVEEVRDYIEDTLLPNIKTLQDDEYIDFEIWY